MPRFVFDDFARTTLPAATNIGDKSPVSNAQIEVVIEYLKSPGSGPDSVTSYADFVAERMRIHPPKLPEGVDYIAFSGEDRARCGITSAAVGSGSVESDIALAKACVPVRVSYSLSSTRR